MSEQPMAYEEVPGSRTLQQAVEQPQRQRWAYEELQAGDLVQAGDQWQNSDGRWHALVLTPEASMNVGEGLRVRRPHNITMMLAAFASSAEVLADAQQAATQLQDERDEARKALTQMLAQLTNQTEVLTEVRADEKRLFDDLELLRSEYIKLQAERDNALAALKSAQRARDELQLQVDELRADRERLQGLIDNLLDEPTAKRVYKMLEDMLDQTEWVGQCLDSSTYEQMSCIQRTISVIGERVRDMVKEGTSAND